LSLCYYMFLFHHTATTYIYTLSLHDALPILNWARVRPRIDVRRRVNDAIAKIVLATCSSDGTCPAFRFRDRGIRSDAETGNEVRPPGTRRKAIRLPDD